MGVREVKRWVALVRYGFEILLAQGPDRAFLLTIRQLSWELRFQNRVAALPPRAAGLVSSFTTTVVRATIRSFRALSPHKYTDADPYATIHVDPDEITLVSSHHGTKRRGWVIDGGWDRVGDRFIDRPTAAAIQQRYDEGAPWSKTPLSTEFDDPTLFERKCKNIEHLYERITSEGYRSQQELLAIDPALAWSGVNATISPLTNEITVDIGRNGEVLWNMLGKHRLSIAKVAGVETVPVLVFSRHREWQSLRDRARRGEEIPERFHNHPDLADLLEDS